MGILLVFVCLMATSHAGEIRFGGEKLFCPENVNKKYAICLKTCRRKNPFEYVYCKTELLEKFIKACISGTLECDGGLTMPKSQKEVLAQPPTYNTAKTCECGVPNVASRIAGGTEVNPKRKYPWQIGLASPMYFINCGGSIINDRWILTAAHCIVDKNTCQIVYNSKSAVRVIVGEHDQFRTSDNDPSNTKKYKIKTWIKHPRYNCKTVDYDFALLEVSEPITFNNVVRPICLPKDDTKTYVGQTATVSGWGSIDNKGGQMSMILKELQVPILANDKCGKWGAIPSMKMCAGGEAGKNSCIGDSGGPLSVVQNGRFVQVGVVSYGGEEGCAAADWPAIYARTSKVLSWISTTTAGGKECN